jgi:hypothetical protein
VKWLSLGLCGLYVAFNPQGSSQLNPVVATNLCCGNQFISFTILKLELCISSLLVVEL